VATKNAAGPKAEAEEVEARVLVTPATAVVLAVHEPGLPRMKLKSERAEPISDGGQKVFGLALVDTVDNHVIRVALEGTLRVLPVHPAIERVVHEQIGEQRGDGRAL
jgi:hypothetical protein